MRSLTLGQGHSATGEGSGPTVVDSLVIDGSDEESRDDGRKQCSRVDERLDHGTHEYEEGILILIPSLKPFFIKFLRDLVIGGPNPRMYTLRYGGSFMAG